LTSINVTLLGYVIPISPSKAWWQRWAGCACNQLY
jgi:hypothetical protein